MAPQIEPFLHALSRFRSAYATDIVFEWQSRHFYEVAKILAKQLSSLGLAAQIKLYIADEKIIYASIAVEKIDIDLFGKNATDRFFGSYYENDTLVSHALSSANDIDHVLQDYEFFLDNWTIPPTLYNLIDEGITSALHDLTANSH